MRDERRANHRAGPWSIFHDDRLPQPLADALGGKSRDQVVRTARSEPDDEADRMIGPFRACRRRGNRESKNRSCDNDQLFYHCFLLGSGFGIPTLRPAPSGLGIPACAVFLRSTKCKTFSGNGATFFAVMLTCKVILSQVADTQFSVACSNISNR